MRNFSHRVLLAFGVAFSGPVLAADNWMPSIATTLGFRALYLYDQQYKDFSGSFLIHETLLGPQVQVTYKF